MSELSNGGDSTPLSTGSSASPIPEISNGIRAVTLGNVGCLTVRDFLRSVHTDDPIEDSHQVEEDDVEGGRRSEEEARNDGTEESDAWPGLGGYRAKANPDNRSQGIKMPVSRDSEFYNMSHKKRGIAFIFNHKNFHSRLGLKTRNGTDADQHNLSVTLRSLDFEVRAFTDLPFREIERLLEDASNANHWDSDCILVSVLSHGEMNILYAYDQPYKPDWLWSFFNSDKCPSLAGKPKLFFIQACQGDQLDAGVKMVAHNRTETDSLSMSYKIPSHADFLIGYSTIPGYYSWRNTTNGSWFIQALCYVLQKEGRTRDLLSLCTRVSRKVALDFQSNTPGDQMMHEKKQIPCITSMLTRDVYFERKPTVV